MLIQFLIYLACTCVLALWLKIVNMYILYIIKWNVYCGTYVNTCEIKSFKRPYTIILDYMKELKGLCWHGEGTLAKLKILSNSMRDTAVGI